MVESKFRRHLLSLLLSPMAVKGLRLKQNVESIHNLFLQFCMKLRQGVNSRSLFDIVHEQIATAAVKCNLNGDMVNSLCAKYFINLLLPSKFEKYNWSVIQFGSQMRSRVVGLPKFTLSRPKSYVVMRITVRLGNLKFHCYFTMFCDI